MPFICSLVQRPGVEQALLSGGKNGWLACRRSQVECLAPPENKTLQMEQLTQGFPLTVPFCSSQVLMRPKGQQGPEESGWRTQLHCSPKAGSQLMSPGSSPINHLEFLLLQCFWNRCALRTAAARLTQLSYRGRLLLSLVNMHGTSNQNSPHNSYLHLWSRIINTGNCTM